MATPWKCVKKIINSYFCPTATNLTADQNEKNVWGQINLIKVQIFWEGHKNLKKISHFVLKC